MDAHILLFTSVGCAENEGFIFFTQREKTTGSLDLIIPFMYFHKLILL